MRLEVTLPGMNTLRWGSFLSVLTYLSELKFEDRRKIKEGKGQGKDIGKRGRGEKT